MTQYKRIVIVLKMQEYVFQYASDIHIEFVHDDKLNTDHFKELLPPVAPYLILAGNIGNASPDNIESLKLFLRYCDNTWKRVIYVPGNHEYYRSTIEDVNRVLRDFCNCQCQHISYLNNGSAKIGNITIVGSTLWTHVTEMPALVEVMNADYTLIKEFDLETSNELHAMSKVFLAQEINRQRCLVVTHHVPSRDLVKIPLCNKNQHLNVFDYDLSEASGTNITHEFNSSKIISWIYGHSRHNCDVIIDDIRLITNQRGYGCKEIKRPYDPVKTLNIFA